MNYNGRCAICGVHDGALHPEYQRQAKLQTSHRGAPKPDGAPGSKDDTMDVRAINLWALCQWCHAAYDRSHNKRQRSEGHRRRRIDAGELPLPLHGESDEE